MSEYMALEIDSHKSDDKVLKVWALNSLPAGKYDLNVTVTDEVTGTTIRQQTDFEIH